MITIEVVSVALSSFGADASSHAVLHFHCLSRFLHDWGGMYSAHDGVGPCESARSEGQQFLPLPQSEWAAQAESTFVRDPASNDIHVVGHVSP